MANRTRRRTAAKHMELAGSTVLNCKPTAKQIRKAKKQAEWDRERQRLPVAFSPGELTPDRMTTWQRFINLSRFDRAHLKPNRG